MVELQGFIGKKLSEVVGNIKMKFGHFIREIDSESLYIGHKIIISLFCCRVLSYGIEVQAVLVGHICTFTLQMQ